MKRLRWQLLVVVLALVAIGVLLVSQQPVLLPSILDAPVEPEQGGMYSEALLGSPLRLNPLLDAFNPADRAVDRVLYSGLIRFDDRGIPQGDLAESWGISQDGTVYNFSIRPNAVWHDGQPVTSQDVIFTVGLLQEGSLPLPPDLLDFWSQIEVKLLDEKTLQFHLPEPFSPFLDYLTFGVLPEHLLGQMTAEEMVDAPFNMEPVGSGPYRFDNLIVEGGEVKGISLQAFPEYYGQPPFIEQLIFRYYPDSAAALDAYRAGEVMGISQITPDVLEQALKEPNLNLYTGRLPRLSMVFLNLDNRDVPFFQDVAVRRAMLSGLNRQKIIDRVLGGQAILADGPIFPSTWAYYDNVEHVGYDRQQAMEVLKDAGYLAPAEGGTVREKDGVSLSFELVYPDDPLYQAQAELIQQDWERLGMQVELVPVPYNQLVTDYLETRDYEAALVELNLSGSPDPDPYPFWHQAQIADGQNYAQWDDRQASEYLEQGRVLLDMGERTRLYRNFQVRFAAEMPALPLYYPVYSYGVDAEVQGVQMGPLFDTSDRLNTITSWYLRTKRAGAQPDVVQETNAPLETVEQLSQ